MKARRMIRVLCAAVLLAAIPPAGGTATARTGELDCPSGVLHEKDVVAHQEQNWSYVYELSWCVQAGEIADVAPAVRHTEDGVVCAWAGSKVGWVKREEGTDGRIAFNMSEFSCQKGDGTGTQGVNPWGQVAIYPDGTYQVRGEGVQKSG